MINKLEECKKSYPWLGITTTVEEYVEPTYYNRILKDYIFNGKSDLDYFKEWLEELNSPKKVLELGCGSGRATDILMKNIKNINLEQLYLLDLSEQMLEFTKNKFINKNFINYIHSDSIKYMEESEKSYDAVYSLWSFSHSVHQWLTLKGYSEGREYVKDILEKFIKENINNKGEFFLIHFDSKSDEQTILLKQWRKVFPIFNDLSEQSPSKLLIDEKLLELKNKSIIDFEVEGLLGEEIVYTSESEALEIFLNFHMESYFNEKEEVVEVIEDLKQYFNQFKDKDGKIKIRPGCFIYKIKKVV